MRVPLHHLKPMLGRVHLSQLKPLDNPVPESPDTLAIQVRQLEQGKRRVVFLPKGSVGIGKPKMAKMLETPKGVFFYNPALIDSFKILAAIDGDRLNDVLGATDGGMGPESKPDIVRSGQPAVAVVGESRNGTTTQGILATPSGIAIATKQVKKVTPRNGRVVLKSPDSEVRERLATK